MSGAEDSESPQVKLMHEWGQGFVKMDVDLIAKHLHKDYRHFRYPHTVGLPEETRDEYLQHMAKVTSLWNNHEASVHSIIDASAGNVVVHVTSQLKTKAGDTTRETIYIAQIVTDENGGLKIKQIEEFTDSQAHLDFVQAVTNMTAGKD